MKSVIKFPGAKWSICDWIISQFQEHHSYLEPYFCMMMGHGFRMTGENVGWKLDIQVCVNVTTPKGLPSNWTEKMNSIRAGTKKSNGTGMLRSA